LTVALPQIFSRYMLRLEQAGIDQAEAEIELILCHLLGVDRLKLYLDGAGMLTDELVRRADEIVERRATRYPLQYILEEAWFYGRSFFVSPAVMVPTPETELLVETAVNFCRRQGYSCPRILDLGVGSGVISVTLANELDDCRIVALDLSPEAIEVARRNAETLSGADRIEFRESDYFGAVAEGEQFDLILSNPPYIAESDYAGLPPEVLADPKLALTSGADGLDAMREILRDAPNILAPGGRVMFEIGFNQAANVTNATAGDPRYQTIVILKDLNDIDRVVILSCEV